MFANLHGHPIYTDKERIMKIQTTKYTILPLVLSALMMSACSQSVKPTDKNDNAVTNGNANNGNGPQSGTIGSGGASGVNTSETGGDRSNFNYLPGNGVNNDPNSTNDLTLAGLRDPNNLLSRRVIFFDYNKASIRPEFMVLINTHAKLAAKFPQLKMRLEGHADERGSREYNVALSEARAQSVKSLMGIQGARSGQIRTIGYGEEVPIVPGHNKNSWKQNRRVEIKYDNY